MLPTCNDPGPPPFAGGVTATGQGQGGGSGGSAGGFAAFFPVDGFVVEIKTVEKLAPIHEAQLLTYLKLTGFRVGLLINFNVRLLKDGMKRMVL